MNLTTPTETELSSVNSILIAIGQAPVSRLYIRDEEDRKIQYTHEEEMCGKTLTFTGEQNLGDSLKLMQYVNPEVAMIHNILMEVNSDVQNEGWVWNRENHYPLTPDAEGHIDLPNNILRMDVWENEVYRDSDLVRRQGRLYDKMRHTDKFDPLKAIYFNIVWKWDYEDLPSVFKRYITLRASGRAATQLVTNPQLVQLLATQEASARAACVEYECNQGDHTFFGTPPGTAYRSYQPYRTLAR
jgi:hypothetical protein